MSDPVYLTGLAEAIGALSDGERFELVDTWARLNETLGRGSSGWLGYWVDQRIGELTGERPVALGPTTELRRGEIRGLSGFTRSMIERPLLPSRFVAWYWHAVSVLFGERAVDPTAWRLSLGVQRADLFTRFTTAQHPHAGRNRPPADHQTEPEGGTDG